MNAVHTAYDWNGSHEHQNYMTKNKIKLLFLKLGINETDVIELKTKGLYRIRKHSAEETLITEDEKFFEFGDN